MPFKTEVMKYLDTTQPSALRIGAVNTLKWTSDGWIGYNTDHYGFSKSLAPLLDQHHQKALILGTGGAAKSVSVALDDLGIEWLKVSRTPQNEKEVSYEDLNAQAVKMFPLIINTTPLGTYPKVEEYPTIPYEHLGPENLMYDLVYNPAQTRFLELSGQKGAKLSNGYNMLVLQAEKAWEIWHE